MNRLIGVLVGILAVSTAFAGEDDFRCLKSVGLKKPLRLQFIFPTDKDDIGFVRYQSGSGSIKVKRVKEKELRKVPGGRLSEFETQWAEITADGTGGTYVVVTQDALIAEFRYIRKDGKMFRFEEDLDASTDNGCEWTTK